MKKEYFNLLSCITCKRNNLSLITSNSWDQNDNIPIEEGIIKCNNCDAFYPILDGIPCFLPKNLQKRSMKEKIKLMKKKFLSKTQ